MIKRAFILFILISSCQPEVSVVPADEPTAEITASQPSLPETPTPTNPTATPTPGVTAEPTLSPIEMRTKLKFECVEEVKEYDFDGSLEGRVLRREWGDDGVENYLLDLSTGIRTAFAENAAFGIDVSPDYTKIAYEDEFSELIVVVDINGSVIASIPIIGEDGIPLSVGDWVNDQTLVLIKHYWSFSSDEPFHLSNLLLWDIENDEIQEVVSEGVPRILDHQLGVPNLIPWNSYRFTNLFIDPRLSRVLYVWYDDKAFEFPQLVLWDFENQNEIRMIYQNKYFISLPDWSRSGERFITIAPPRITQGDNVLENYFDDDTEKRGDGDELVVVDRDGMIYRLTHLTNEFSTSIFSPSLSPDEKKISFHFFNRETRGSSLVVLDMKSGWSTNFCISGGVVEEPILWSPDSKYLLIDQGYEDGDKQFYESLILNTETGEVWRIYNYLADSFGWLP